MHPALAYTEHRPYALPKRPWVLQMEWLDLLFMHWALPPELLAPQLPLGLELDTFNGKAYLGVVPFMMQNVYPRGTFAVKGLSHFPELNVRTYVRAGGKAGVWFFSLDADNKPAVRLARSAFKLPYFDAAMTYEPLSKEIRFESRRTHKNAERATFVGRYRPDSSVRTAKKGGLEYFLTERYCLYSGDDSKLLRGDIHHMPWDLQDAQADISVNHMSDQIGIALPDEEPLLHFAKKLSVVAWLPQEVS